MISITDLVVVDETRRRLTCPVVVLGAASASFVAQISATRELGQVAGWTLAIAAYALDMSTDLAMWRRTIQASSWWVIASSGPAADPTWAKRFEELTRLIDAQRSDVVVALAGPPEIAATWRAYGGPAPLVHDTSPDVVLRALVHDFVRRMRP